MNEILTINETAKYLKVCDKTIRKLINNNELCASKVGNSWRIRKSDIEKYLDNNMNGRSVCNE